MGIIVVLLIEILLILAFVAVVIIAIYKIALRLLGLGKGMDKGLEEYRGTPGAVLIDVRTTAEFKLGHVEGSVNIPLDEVEKAADRLPDMTAPLFVYGASGIRSKMAVSKLKKLGYSNVKNIGGLDGYKGKVVKA